MAKKMPRKLVALGASAIATVYAVGYVETIDADSLLAAMVARALHQPTNLVAGTVPGSSLSSSQAVQSTPVDIRRSQAISAAGYRDGTYHGVGVSRRGAIEVFIEVQRGLVTNVSITRSNTPYPVAQISALLDQVVIRQSASIDNISGATYSSIAFQAAVEETLAQAQTGQAYISAPPVPLPSAESTRRPSRPLYLDPEESQQLELELADNDAQPVVLQSWAGFIELIITNRGSRARRILMLEGRAETTLADVDPGATMVLRRSISRGDYMLRIYDPGQPEGVSIVPFHVR